MLIKKTDLLDLLRKQQVLAEAHDTANMAQHEKDKKAAVVLFRERLKAARTWTYDEIKEQGFRAGLSDRNVRTGLRDATGQSIWVGERPQCPAQMAPQFGRAITEVERDSRKQFTLEENGKMSRIYRLAVWDPNAAGDQAC